MASAVDYVFTRDYVDNNRINLQHYLWITLFGYHIHPNISTENSHLRIADVGTGTGSVKNGIMQSESSQVVRIWLTDLSAQLPPSVRLDGLDISSIATPPRAWLPRNMAVRHWDVKTTIPDDLIGVYDIVHIRNFAFVLRDDDVQGVLANLIRLISTYTYCSLQGLSTPNMLMMYASTEPGGYLQWAEPDVASFRIEKANPNNETKALRQLLELSQAQDSRLSPTWVPRLATIFAASGLVDIQSDVRDAAPHLALAMHECNLSIHELIARKTQNEGVAEKVEDLMPNIANETREGSCWAFTRWTVIGRKADGC
ncbi:MAG: hypothetical protein L6R42_001800 [Xanthoria sp. 1 TBL-2021]|nr:MAG: hypothetical protein L6R42_001800 [Xanthoria sp. 1 TBL-2021]